MSGDTMSARFRLVALDTAADAERQAAMAIRSFVSSRPAPVLGLATGRTMIPVYAWLVEWHRREKLSLAGCTSFNLDEYCGLLPDHPSSFAGYMRRHLFDHVDMRPDRWHMPPHDAGAQAYDDLIRRNGGIGLQLLGLGRNGHIGFNEPGSSRHSRTRRVELAASTRHANQRDFPPGEDVPTHAVTMGIRTILDADRIVLLATGAGKADALHRAFHGPISADCPGSYLQLHNRVTVICDRAAGASFALG